MVRRLLVAVALLSLAPACGGAKTSLTKIEAPAEGVALAYDLAPGLVYKGRVSSGEKVQGTSGSTVSRSFSFDVTLTIRGADPNRGGILVTARYSNVDIKWGLPTSVPFSIGDLVDDAKSKLKGLEVDFNVDETGKVIHMPEPPEDLGPELRYILQEALDTLETAFFPVPARPLKPGDTWKDEKTRGREGKLGRYLRTETTTKVDGFYRAPEGDDVAKLLIDEKEDEVTTTKSGSHRVNREKTTEILFAHTKKYLFNLSREQTSFDPGVATIYTNLDVHWQKSGAPGTSTAPALQQTQTIDDPCHPDYVGGDECTTNPPAPAEPAPPAGAATPTAPPAKPAP